LGTRHPEMPRRALLSDVRDRDGVIRLVREEAPQLVFHAAALKHVPIVEAQPIEGVLTNVIGTRYVADACRQAGVLAMVLISTDKAVNPASVMGATKRLAEGYCQALDIAQSPGGRTRFLTVRFGNVLGSTGSVVPLFQRQIQAGGPLTVTHPEVSRYFMTTREAVELVLEASVLGASGKGGTGKILVLDMGEPIRILDLAKQMIRLAGLEPGADVAISFTGLRPGEKLHEELFHSGESALQTEREGILLAAPRAVDLPFLAHAIDELAEAAAAGRADHALSIHTRLVPEYRPARGGAARAAAGG
ncbi:MAG: polysaccharide biosynthesis protein, partial [Alphaproteobacteria bacterium]